MVLHDTANHSAQKAGLEGTRTTFTPHGDPRFKPQKINEECPLVYELRTQASIDHPSTMSARYLLTKSPCFSLIAMNKDTVDLDIFPDPVNTYSRILAIDVTY